MAQIKLWAKARVKILTEQGKWLLMEIRGLEEGTEIAGTLTPDLDRFDFSWGQYGAMLVPGENCEIIEQEQLTYVVVDAERYDEHGYKAFWNDSEIGDWMEFETLQEAKAFSANHEGRIRYGASIINADENSPRYGDYIIEPYYRDTMKEARAAIRKEL